MTKSDLTGLVYTYVDHSRHNRVKCELKLETTARSAQYSPRLMDMMRREEGALRDGAAASDDMFKKVDELIGQETRSIFAKITGQNCNTWSSFNKSLINGAKKFVEETRHAYRGSPDSVTSIAGDTNPSRSARNAAGAEGMRAPVDMWYVKESLRLEEHYNRDWLDIETFHLTEAFKSQEAKITTEWAEHEGQLTRELMNKRAELDPTDAADVGGRMASPSGSDSGSERWHSAEKQKTLIHTAPVLSPVRARASSFGRDGKSKFSRGDPALMEQLMRLEREYSVVMESLKRQRLSAMRWMTRQQVRFMAQAVEMHKERLQIAKVIELDLRVVEDICDSFPQLKV